MLRGLHKQCDKENWEGAIESLADERNKKSASRKGGWGDWTPLHLAIKRGPPLVVVQALVDVAPDAAGIPDVYNRLAIHYAVESGLDEDVINALVSARPSSICEVENEGKTPLHLSIFSSSEAGEKIRNPPSFYEIELLLDDDGTVARSMDTGGYLPLHHVCDNIDDYTEDILLILIEAFPPSVQEKNPIGLTPLHQVLKHSKRSLSRTDIALLLDDEGIVANTTDSEGNLPLHVVCSEIEKYDESIVEALVLPFPSTLLEKNAEGLTPLNQVLEKGMVTEHMLSILMKTSKVLQIADNENCLPLHNACRNMIPYNFLEEMLERFPAATAHSASNGGYPLQILEKRRCMINEDEAIKEFNEMSDLLFVHYPNIMPFKEDILRLQRLKTLICDEIERPNSFSATARLAWTWMCGITEDQDDIYFTTVSSIVQSISNESARTLATMKNCNGTPLLDNFSQRCAKYLLSCLRFADSYEFKAGPYVEKNEESLTIRAKHFPTKEGRTTYESPCDVVIRFLSNREYFLRETALHSQLKFDKTNPSPVLPILKTYDIYRLGSSKEQDGDAAFSRDIQSNKSHDLALYKYAIVQPEAGPNFESILSGRKSDVGEPHKFLRQIGTALRSLHDCGLSCGEIRRRSLVFHDNNLSYSDLEQARKSRKEFYGTEFSSGVLPPEMIAKLDNDAIRKYCKYWKTAIDDSIISKLLLSDDVLLISDKVNSFLLHDEYAHSTNLQGTFLDFWDRVKDNAKLWRKIEPKFSDGNYYVMKSCKIDHATRFPHSISKLPFSPIRASPSVDVWCFAVFFYEMCSGEPLFPVSKSNNLINGEDFARIHHWDINSEYAARKICAVDDPLARDLLREVLRPHDHRPAELAKVLEHPYFCVIKEKDLELKHELKKICLAIIHKEDSESLAKEKAKKKLAAEQLREKNKQDWLHDHSSTISVLTPDTQLKMDRSSWSQWKYVDQDATDSTFPTCFTVLPYEINESCSGGIYVSTENKQFANRMGLLLSNIMHATTLVCESEGQKRRSGGSLEEKLDDLNKSAGIDCEGDVGEICESIIALSRNAQIVLDDVLDGLVPDSSTEASKLVRDVVERHVSLDLCKEVSSKARTCMSLRDNPSTHGKKVLESMFQAILGSDCHAAISSHRVNLEKELLCVVEEFIGNPLSALKQLLIKSVQELTGFIMVFDKLFFYLVDEVTGLPVKSGTYPHTIDVTPSVLRLILPGLRLSIKTLCSLNATFGLASATGISADEIPPMWRGIEKLSVGSFGKLSSIKEFSVFENAVDRAFHMATGETNFFDIRKDSKIERYQKFLLSLDPDRDYANMHRICGPDGLVLWTTDAGEAKLEKSNLDVLNEYASRKALEAMASVENIWTTNGSASGERDNDENKGATESVSKAVISLDNIPIRNDDCILGTRKPFSIDYHALDNPLGEKDDGVGKLIALNGKKNGTQNQTILPTTTEYTSSLRNYQDQCARMRARAESLMASDIMGIDMTYSSNITQEKVPEETLPETDEKMLSSNTTIPDTKDQGMRITKALPQLKNKRIRRKPLDKNKTVQPGPKYRGTPHMHRKLITLGADNLDVLNSPKAAAGMANSFFDDDDDFENHARSNPLKKKLDDDIIQKMISAAIASPKASRNKVVHRVKVERVVLGEI